MAKNSYTKHDVYADAAIIVEFETNRAMEVFGIDPFRSLNERSTSNKMTKDDFDPKNLEISRVIENAWEYVFEPKALSADDWVWEATSWFFFRDAYFPLWNSELNTNEFRNNTQDTIGHLNGALENLFKTACARWSLAEGYSVRDQELALVAQVSLRTLKNALSSKDENRLSGERKVDIDGSIYFEIEHDEAIRWLAQRRGYVPIFGAGNETQNLDFYLKNSTTPLELAAVIKQNIASHNAIDLPEDCPNKDLYWQWWHAQFSFDENLARWVSEKAGLDFPCLAGKILEMGYR